MGRDNFYMPFFIDAYIGDTMHLSQGEDGAYIRLLMHYWKTGQALPGDKDKLYRIAKGFSETDRFSIDKVLDEFFVLKPDGRYHQKRMDEDLETHRKKAENSRKNGTLGGRPKTQEKPEKNPGQNLEKTQNITQTKPAKNLIQIQNQIQIQDPETETSTLNACAREGAPPEMQKLEPEWENAVLQAYGYLKKSGNINFMNFAGVDNSIREVIREIRKLRPDLTPDEVLSCWHESCDKAREAAVSSFKWYKTAWKNKCGAFQRGSPSTKKPQIDRIVSAEERKGGFL